MAAAKPATVLKSIEQLQQECGVKDAVFEGTKAANKWKTGKQMGVQEFKNACEAFRKAPIDGNRTRKEAKG